MTITVTDINSPPFTLTHTRHVFIRSIILCLSDASIRHSRCAIISLWCSSYNPAVGKRFPVSKDVMDMIIILLLSLKRVRIHLILDDLDPYRYHKSSRSSTVAAVHGVLYGHLYIMSVPARDHAPGDGSQADQHLKFIM